jgi:CHRD domain-containing protein
MTQAGRFLGAALVMTVIGVTAVVIVGANGPRHGRATLDGYQEIPTLSTPASGSLRVTISPDENSLTYTLSYEGFETNVLQSHIHLGRPAFSGGIMVFFCTNLTPPAGVPVPPACPLGGGTVTGTLTAADVVGPSAQGVATGEFSEVVAALRAGAAYGNVHTTRFPGGEIRGQVLFDDRDRDDHDRDSRDRD